MMSLTGRSYINLDNFLDQLSADKWEDKIVTEFTRGTLKRIECYQELFKSSQLFMATGIGFHELGFHMTHEVQVYMCHTPHMFS